MHTFSKSNRIYWISSRFLLIGYLLFASFVSVASTMPQEACFTNNMKIVEEFIEPYRKELGSCERDNDCTWAKGGINGIHIAEKFYHKYGNCFKYADDAAHDKCGTKSSSYFARVKTPLFHKCENHQCMPYYRTKGAIMDGNKEFPWRRSHGISNGKKSDEIECKSRFDSEYAAKLKKFEMVLEK